MSDLNVFTCAGRLVRDPEVKTVGNGEVVNFSVAINTWNSREKKEEPFFLDCSSFDNRVVRMLTNVEKGTMLGLTGSLRKETWESDGQKRSTFRMNVTSASFVGSRSKASKTERPDSAGPARAPATEDVGSDDIPF